MLAVQNTESGIAAVEVDAPTGAGTRLQVASAGICGTDVLFASRGVRGFIYGHEFAGIASDGCGYFVEPTVYDGRCEQCRQGFTQRCTAPGHGTLGVFRDGGMAETVVVPASMLLELPAGLDVRDACLVEPASVAWHGVRRAALGPDDRVAIVGGGSIGLLAAAACRRTGHPVDVDARHRHQIEAAERLGAGRPRGVYDVVIDAAGSADGLVRCAELARPGGRVVILSVYLDVVPVPAVASLTKELTYINSIAYDRHDGVRDTHEAATMLAEQPEIVQTLITHRFPLCDATEAFRTARDRASGAIKVVLEG